MSLMQKNLHFTEKEPKKSLKNDQSLKNKLPLTEVAYDIKCIPPDCFKSSFEDDKWISYNLNKSRKNELLNFSLTSSKWAEHTKKILCITYQFQEHASTRIISFGSFSTYFSILTFFFNELDTLNIPSLKSVSEEIFRNIYLKYSAGKTSATNKKYLYVLKKLYDYGPAHHKLLDDGLNFNPQKDSFLVGSAKQSKEVGETTLIEDENALLLISSAIDWVTNKNCDLIDLIELSKIHTAKKLSKNVINVKKALTFVQARAALHENQTSHQKLLQVRKKFGNDLILFLEPGHRVSKGDLEPELRDFMKINLVIKRLHSFYQAFTYVICASFTGWRASEIFSINSSNLKETATGFYLGSNLIKTTQNKKELISRPIPDIVAKAILNLEEINTKMEGVFTHKLITNDKQEKCLFRSPFGNSIDIKTLNEDLNTAWKYISSEKLNFSTHQFRRFFAHFYIRRYKGTADAVRWNFRHVSKDMILHYTRQAMNAKQLAISKKELAQEIVNKIVEENEYTSISIGNDLKDFSNSLKIKAKILSIEEASKYIDEKIQSEFKDIHAMEWGYCMFQSGYKGAACEAKTGPIESRAEPSTCGRCKFLCTGSENIEFWQQTVLLHQDIRDNKFATYIMKNESEKLITTGSTILKRHKEQE